MSLQPIRLGRSRHAGVATSRQIYQDILHPKCVLFYLRLLGIGNDKTNKTNKTNSLSLASLSLANSGFIVIPSDITIRHKLAAWALQNWKKYHKSIPAEAERLEQVYWKLVRGGRVDGELIK